VHFGYHANNVNPNPGNGVFAWLYRTDAQGCIFKDCHLSQEELAALPVINIYPNPSKGKFYLDLAETEEIPAVLEIYNTAGALVESHSLSGQNQNRLTIYTPLSAGNYYVLLRTSTGKELGVARLVLVN
jgi:hypothetical protein